MNNSPEIDHSRESAVNFFLDYVKKNGNLLSSKRICDLSAGRGYIARLFEEVGAEVHGYDLFPDQNRFLKTSVQKIDLQQIFPIEGARMDLVICCETIEHLPNQYFLFQETSRILKGGGIFILTTPNSSSLRSRFSQFMMESEHYGAPAPNELNAFTSWDGGKDGYFSKLFISGVLRLRTMAALNLLVLSKIHSTKRSSTSALLLFWYPVLYYFNWKAMKKQIKQNPDNENTYRTIFKLNTSMDVLLGKHLIMEFEKK
ncbi:class I SAM-dependent methyltransferase [Dolichospermum sp. ST_sed3]|nr:class I SAM-dependent methyltransferase [Dolichospermum sp. ST_sed3]